MKVMYIMPRYHTNLIPTIEGWISHKDQVTIVTHSKGKIEDYSVVVPIVAGYSKIFKVFLEFYKNVLKRNNPIAGDISLRLGFPPIGVIKKIIRDVKPDLVIVREKSVYSIACTHICRKYRIKMLLYNQSPVWADKAFFKDDFAHKIVNSLTPAKRITPVNQILDGNEGKIVGDGAVFAPFVMNPVISPEEKQYFQDDNINILVIGKYEKRKNHFMMIDVFSRLVDINKSVRLVVVGEKTSRFHEDYYNSLSEYVKSKGLDNRVDLKYNLNRKQIDEEYRTADLFVLPSTGEPAAISCIEAMAYSLPAISGSDNGTADYIVSGETGYIFKDRDADDLFEGIKAIITDKDKLIKMGANAYQRVTEYCSFEKYYEAIIATGVLD